jgi:hypothetical protein
VQSGGGGQADRRSAWRKLVRDQELREEVSHVGVPDLERLEIVRRGPSGRVVELKAIGRSGAEKAFEGFPIRRALDLPELFSFTFVRARRRVGASWAAWGHGVGCARTGFGLSARHELRPDSRALLH